MVRPVAVSGMAYSLWPLPGGGSAWKESLDRMVRYVASEAPTMAEAISWMIEKFDRVGSAKTVRGYWQVLRSFGLIETQGEQVGLTAAGAEYRRDPSAERLLGIARRRIVGVDQMLGWLSRSPMTTEELLGRFRSDLGMSWESPAQVQYRLGWLVVLGTVSQQGDRWAALPATEGSEESAPG